MTRAVLNPSPGGVNLSPAAKEANLQATKRANEVGIEFQLVTDLRGCQEVDRFLAGVWELPEGSNFTDSHLLRALSEVGYVSAAYHAGEMIAASFGFVGFEDGTLVLRSHATGVRADWRNRAVGAAIKLHQRAWALERDVDVITWSFDPLLRRNAFFNVRKLGAEAHRYVRDMYGPFAVGIYARPVSDCLIAHWQLKTPRVIAALSGGLPNLDATEHLKNGAVKILEVNKQGSPATHPVMGQDLLCEIPEDITKLRLEDPKEAQAWQDALRGTLAAKLDDGYSVVDFLPEGCYVLQRL